MRTRNGISCTIRTKPTKLCTNSAMKVTVKTCTQTWADQFSVYIFFLTKENDQIFYAGLALLVVLTVPDFWLFLLNVLQQRLKLFLQRSGFVVEIIQRQRAQ